MSGSILIIWNICSQHFHVNLVFVTPTMLNWLRRYLSRGTTLNDTFHTTRFNMRLAILMVTYEIDCRIPGGMLPHHVAASSPVEKKTI